LLVPDEKYVGTNNIAKHLVKDNELKKQGNINKLFRGDPNITGDIPNHVRTCWKRCIELGLSPHEPPKLQKVPEYQLKLIKERYSALLDIMDQFAVKMSAILPRDSFIIGLSDKSGVLFYVKGNHPELTELGYRVGYVHTESNMGNNAIGTCIYNNEPTVVFGSEHFLKSLSKWTDYAAPIHNIDGELEAVIMLIIPAELANNSFLGMIMVVAEGIEKELKLLQEKAELIRTNEILSEFGQEIINAASMLSHEVKNSLSNISAYIQLLRLEKVLDGNRTERILTEISQINKILDSLKRLTKPIHMNFSLCCLNSILHSTIEIMKPKATFHGIQLKISIPEKPIYKRVDKNALQQVFVNIIENAIQAMEDGGLLDIKLEYIKKSRDIRIAFTDTGHGMSEEQLGQIFKLFYTTKENGSGLGLSVCQSIIKCHGGEIKVHSIPGKGSTFTIILPES